MDYLPDFLTYASAMYSPIIEAMADQKLIKMTFTGCKMTWAKNALLCSYLSLFLYQDSIL